MFEEMRAYFSLDDKVAIVTGSGNGIGERTAKMLASFGAKVVICDVEGENAERVKAEIVAYGGEAIAVVCDVRSEESILNAVKTTIDEYKTVDILVNNAGGGGHGKTLDDMSLNEWNRLVELNLTNSPNLTGFSPAKIPPATLYLSLIVG